MGFHASGGADMMAAWRFLSAALAVACSSSASGAGCGNGDWLLDPSRYKAVVREADGAWILENGLARREKNVVFYLKNVQ